MATAWSRGTAETGEWLEVYGETEPRSVPLERIFARLASGVAVPSRRGA
ncbi:MULTISPECIES: hypothetical protein [unclassified Streptomyces]